MSLTIEQLRTVPTAMLEHAIDHNNLAFEAMRKRLGHCNPAMMQTGSPMARAIHEALDQVAWLQSELIVRDLRERLSADKTRH